MDSPSIIPSHDIASWLLRHIDGVLDSLGLHHYQTVEEVIYLVVISLAAFGIAWVIKRLIYVVLRKIVRMRNGVFGRELLEWHTLSKVCQIIPPLILFAMVPFAFEGTHPMRTWIFRIVGIYSMCAFGYAICAIFTFVYNHYNIHNNKKNLPLKGLLNVAKGIIWIVIGICAVATLVGKSPAYLLTGLTAFAAALMLVFKDTILGFVAGIQMNENDMIHVGDWIIVPGTPANGVVTDMSLSAVKIMNFDNTTVTVPPYTLISTSFQNYRSMSLGGARRIMRNLLIDLTTIKRLTPADVDRMAAPFPELQKFVAKLRADKATEMNQPGLTPINGTIETNLGLFRAYVCLYLYNNPNITRTQQMIVNLSDTNSNGALLQIYCFANTSEWDSFEAIQSDVLEHVITAVDNFDLAIYTTGSLDVDMRPEPAPGADATAAVKAPKGPDEPVPDKNY